MPVTFAAFCPNRSLRKRCGHRALAVGLLAIVLSACGQRAQAATVEVRPASSGSGKDGVIIPANPAETPGGAGSPGSGSHFVITTTNYEQAHVVYFALTGAAINGVDYGTYDAATGQWTALPASSSSFVVPRGGIGYSSGQVAIVPRNDGVAEGDESVTLTILPHASYTIGAGGSATLTIKDYVQANAPTITQAAAAVPANVTKLSTALSVLAADALGEDGLIYTWSSPTNLPSVIFTGNATNQTKLTTARFQAPGSYPLTCTVTNANNVAVQSTVTVTVVATMATMTVQPGCAVVPPAGTALFALRATDQFGQVMPSPAVTWSTSGGGSIAATGLFTAGSASGLGHVITATTTAGMRTATVDVIASTAANINFQPAGAAIPAGYLADTGELYGARNGKTYGWNKTHADVTRERNLVADQRLDTLCHFHSGGIWEMAVPPGRYQVKVVVGDPANASAHTIIVEGSTFFANQSLAAGATATKTQTVTVTDGRLTITQGAAAEKATRIDYLEVVSIPASAIAVTGPTSLGTGATGTYTVTLTGTGTHTIGLTGGATFGSGGTSQSQSAPGTATYSIVAGVSGGSFVVTYDGVPAQTVQQVQVTIGDVVRSAGFPLSVPPGKERVVAVTIAPAVQAPGFVHFEVLTIGTGGSAVITAGVDLTTSGNITIRGADQSKNGGACRVTGTLSGALAPIGSSNQFYVCAHMENMQVVNCVDDPDPLFYGIVARSDWASDGAGGFKAYKELEEVMWKELIGLSHRDNPPFLSYIPKVGVYEPTLNDGLRDTHSVRRDQIVTANLPPPPMGSYRLSFDQAHVFKCQRCGCQDKAVLKGGFLISHSVASKASGGGWVEWDSKTGGSVTVAPVTCTAGAGSVLSLERPLP